ncbi:MAG: hypothetical protein IJ342_00400 [Muribaculaceae bacterium]|nr:hypothetical protein [Muribaculaceae bacterium]
MNAKEFFDLVAQMRHHQKEYFKTKSVESLRYSKDLERKVDAEIQRVKQIINELNKPRLDL